MRDIDPSIPDRVRLDEITEADFLVIRKWFLASAPETQTCRPLALKTDAEALQKFRERKQEDTGRDYAIRRIADDRLLGRIRYFDLNVRNRSAEIGYILDPDERGHGFAAEALGLLLKHLFNEKRLNKVYAQTAEFNTASIALLNRCGFQLDGRLRQHHELNGVLFDDLIFSLLAEEHNELHSSQ